MRNHQLDQLGVGAKPLTHLNINPSHITHLRDVVEADYPET